MHYHDEVFSIVASKLNNDIAGIIMKMFKTPMQCIFEKVYNLTDSVVIPLEKDNYFKSWKDASANYSSDLREAADNFDRETFFKLVALEQSYLKKPGHLHYQRFIKNLDFDPKNTLFVIKNNKIFLKKGERAHIFLMEIVEFTGKVVIYTSMSPVCFLEKGDILCPAYFGYGCSTLYAIEDVEITFDYYVMPLDFRTRLGDIEYPCYISNFEFNINCREKYNEYKHLSDDDIKKYNIERYYFPKLLDFWECFKIKDEYFKKYFAFPE
jgi:hypothetical protein